MKKIFTSVLMALAMMSASAEEYTCPLVLNVWGMGDESAGNVSVTVTKQDDGKYTMQLKNFSLGTTMPIGTIEMKDVDAVTCGNTVCLSSQQTIQIAAGDDESIDYWGGPALGDLAVLLKGQLKDGKFNAILNIPIAGSMIVGVKLGDDANNMSQLPNSGFEEFHTAKASSKLTSDEPNGWHSFMSCTGKYSAFVAGTTHTFIDTDVRKGAESTNTKCVKIISSGMDMSFLSFSANGTITTGRLQANDLTATNQSNCSFLNFETTDTDDNGDPFYAVLNNKPDSLTMWVKHHAGKGNGTNTNATVSALLTNGNYVQDPQIEQYKENIIAEANTTTIAAKDEWEQISIPFTYSKTEETPKAALVTMSTCSVPGGGSKDNNDPDVLYVDDVELVYNAGIKSVSMDGSEIVFDEYNSAEIKNYEGEITPELFTVEAEGAGAYVTTKISAEADDPTTVYVTITVTSNDLKKYDVRTITFTGVSTGIAKATSSVMPTGVKAIYNLSGQQVSSMGKAGAYIIQRTDGTTVKVLKK